jgi:hypothetical protein
MISNIVRNSCLSLFSRLLMRVRSSFIWLESTFSGPRLFLAEVPLYTARNGWKVTGFVSGLGVELFFSLFSRCEEHFWC